MKIKHDVLYIIIPAYNEEENIDEVLKQWYPIVSKIGKESRLVIIDDGSKDGTYKKVMNHSKKMKQLIPITKKNSGHGATILYGYNYAITNGADYIFQTDSDGQTTPSEFWEFWNLREKYEMVIGHRNARKDGISRVFVTKILKMVIKLVFKVNVTYANTPFRLMKASTLKENLKLVPKDFNLSNVIISVIYTKKNLPVKYIPITFKPRQGGINSINFKKIIRIGKQAIVDFRKINKNLNDL